MEEGAEVVNFTAAGEEGGAGTRVARGEVEEVDGGEEASDTEVYVEGPAPGGAAVGEGSADDRTKTVCKIQQLDCDCEFIGRAGWKGKTNTVPKPKVPPTMAK